MTGGVKMPVFSVIIPVYKAEKYLKECVESVLNQSFTDIEVVLVDDGSPDNSGYICDSMAEFDTRITVIHKENGGATKARLDAAKASSGKYIVPVDSDDYVLPGLFERLNDIQKEHDPDIISYEVENRKITTESAYGDLKNRLLGGDEWNKLKCKLVYDKELPGFNSGIATFGVCTKAIKRDIYLRHQETVPSDFICAEDLSVTAPSYKDSKTVYFSDFPGYFYRYNEESTTSTFREDDTGHLPNLREYLISKLGEEHRSAIDAFILINASEYALNAARHYESKKDYLKCLKTHITPELQNIIKGAKLGKLSAKEWARAYLFKYKMYSLLRFLIKH